MLMWMGLWAQSWQTSRSWCTWIFLIANLAMLMISWRLLHPISLRCCSFSSYFLCYLCIITLLSLALTSQILDRFQDKNWNTSTYVHTMSMTWHRKFQGKRLSRLWRKPTIIFLFKSCCQPSFMKAHHVMLAYSLTTFFFPKFQLRFHMILFKLYSTTL